MENNKNLVPAGYTMDWWASDLLEFISNQDEADELAGLLGVNSNDLPMDFLLLKQARMSNSTQEESGIGICQILI